MLSPPQAAGGAAGLSQTHPASRLTICIAGVASIALLLVAGCLDLGAAGAGEGGDATAAATRGGLGGGGGAVELSEGGGDAGGRRLALDNRLMAAAVSRVPPSKSGAGWSPRFRHVGAGGDSVFGSVGAISRSDMVARDLVKADRLAGGVVGRFQASERKKLLGFDRSRAARCALPNSIFFRRRDEERWREMEGGGGGGGGGGGEGKPKHFKRHPLTQLRDLETPPDLDVDSKPRGRVTDLKPARLHTYSPPRPILSTRRQARVEASPISSGASSFEHRREMSRGRYTARRGQALLRDVKPRTQEPRMRNPRSPPIPEHNLSG